MAKLMNFKEIEFKQKLNDFEQELFDNICSMIDKISYAKDSTMFTMNFNNFTIALDRVLAKDFNKFMKQIKELKT